MSQIADLVKENGELPSHSGIGFYPLFYVTQDGVLLCSKCATMIWKEVYVYPPRVNWEDEIYCENCNKQIESAY